jgi:serine/threonine-protein kinase
MAAAVRSGKLAAGSELDGFVIEDVAGRGGMGVVYRARQKQPDRVVALKVIAAEFASAPAFRARFQREWSIAAQIEHPNVIPVYAVGEAGDVLYIAMRFVAGTDLRGLLKREGRLAARRAATIVDQVAQALDAAHAHGLVHRDVKPANILVSRIGRRDHVYLSDFGLSRNMEGSQGLTVSRGVLGSVDYVAPEQVRGERIDARADVYSLGCVLFTALTGTVPFPMDNDLAKLYAHDQQPPPSALGRAEDLPTQFETVLACAMAKAPEKRYSSAGDLGRAAIAAASGEPLSSTGNVVAVGSAAPQETIVLPKYSSAASAGGDATESRAVPITTEPRDRASATPVVRVARRSRMMIAAATATIVACVGVVVVAFGGSAARRSSRAHASALHKPRKWRASSATPAVVGIVPDRAIGSALLGESRRTLTAELVSHGYTAKRSSIPSETIFTAPSRGLYVVGFYGGVAVYIQKYGDPTIAINGVSISSTLRKAEAALPSWRSIGCQSDKYTLLVAPGGHTYFELPLGIDVTNVDGANGVVIAADPRSSCD